MLERKKKDRTLSIFGLADVIELEPALVSRTTCAWTQGARLEEGTLEIIHVRFVSSLTLATRHRTRVRRVFARLVSLLALLVRPHQPFPVRT